MQLSIEYECGGSGNDELPSEEVRCGVPSLVTADATKALKT